MTKRELKQIYYINKEISMWQSKLDKLNSRSLVGAFQVTDMPKKTGTTSNKVEDIVIKKAEINAIIAGLLIKIQVQRREVMNYIDTIEDSLIRQIITYRYIDCMSWMQISQAIYGRLDKDDAVRKMHDRFLEEK